MSKRTRRRHTPEQKAALVRQHVVDKKPVSEICSAAQIQPSVFYKWERDLLAAAPALFAGRRTPSREHELQAKIASLEAKLARKDAIIAVGCAQTLPTATPAFVNGRELHPLDVQRLRALAGTVIPGRWWVDAQGYFGLEGWPPLGNLFLIAQARWAGAGGGSGEVVNQSGWLVSDGSGFIGFQGTIGSGVSASSGG
jgi:transposase